MPEKELIEALKALAHPLRWRIMAAIVGEERNVGEIEQVTGIGQPALSQQLGVLRKAGLVETRKAAKLVYYAVAENALADVMRAMAGLSSDKGTGSARPSPLRAPAPGVANFARLS